MPACAGMTRANDLTRPPRRTESRARRQAARFFAQRRRRPRRIDLENLSRRRRLRRHPLGSRRTGLCAGADARDLCRGDGQPERARRGQAGLRAESLLDVGAGPGTATWAAAEAFPSLQDFTLLDANDALRALALGLVTDSFRLRDVSYERGEARAALTRADSADLVVASYMIGEIGDGERRALTELMWEKTRDTLLVVEPGTPAGYARIIALRERLIAMGAHVAAPCPHDGKCPLQPPDWCHFTQRLQRSRAHKQVKGAELPFEDERFCLCRADARGDCAASCARAGATGRQQGRNAASSARRKVSPLQRCLAAPKRITPPPGVGGGAVS